MEARLDVADRRQTLERAGLLDPRPAAVTASFFDGRHPFFLSLDKVQVKSNTRCSGPISWTGPGSPPRLPATATPAAFYLVAADFHERGMLDLLDERRGRRGPLKMTAEVLDFLGGAQASRSGAELAAEIEARFGIQVHRRTVERARRQ